MAQGTPIEIRATIKRVSARPPRDPGDKPVFELLLRSEVNPTTVKLMGKLGKDATVTIVPEADPQSSLPGMGGDDDDDAGARAPTRNQPPAPSTTTAAAAPSNVTSFTASAAGSETQNLTAPVVQAPGRRKNGTRSSEQGGADDGGVGSGTSTEPATV